MLTNFAALTEEQKTTWSMDLWKHARNHSFINQFLGKDQNSVIQHITELKKTEKGDRAVMTLLADLEGDGVAGDRTLEGNEEAMTTDEQVIRMDQLRHANRSKGTMADQRSIVDFRRSSRDVLAYWLADRMDQMAFLTLGGRSYAYKPDGSARVGSDLVNLEFAADVTGPSALRRLRWDPTDGLVASATTTDVNAGDTPEWDTIMELKRYAKDQYMRGVKGKNGEEIYHAFLCPKAMLRLKQDAAYRDNLRHAQTRGSDNALFTGGAVLIDGVMLHEFRHVPHTSGSGSDGFGNTFDVEGSQIIFCGAQALGMADIGAPRWVEKEFDYENQPAISTAKILGFLKPQFASQYAGTTTPQDFGVLNCYVAHAPA